MWIPNFAFLAQPLHEAARGPLTEPLDPIKPIKTPFLKLQQALLQALSSYMSLREEEWHWELRTNEGSHLHPCSLLSKQLDSIIKG
jgi:hypothetical protein